MSRPGNPNPGTGTSRIRAQKADSCRHHYSPDVRPKKYDARYQIANRDSLYDTFNPPGRHMKRRNTVQEHAEGKQDETSFDGMQGDLLA
jgi:hypothetical protein